MLQSSSYDIIIYHVFLDVIRNLKVEVNH